MFEDPTVILCKETSSWLKNLWEEYQSIKKLLLANRLVEVRNEMDEEESLLKRIRDAEEIFINSLGTPEDSRKHRIEMLLLVNRLVEIRKKNAQVELNNSSSNTTRTDTQTTYEEVRTQDYPDRAPSIISPAVTIGEDIQTSEEVWIGDRERCGGLYALGKPRTGKSHLLKSLALQDAENDHGFLFIDPHADAINDMIERMPVRRKDEVILLDPTYDEYAFGINPLYCTNPKDLRERQLSFGQAWDVFAKVYGEEDGQLGILLSRYLGNCLYPLIENQGYTLYDIWDFLLNKSFRDALLEQVKFHSEVIDFWHKEFDLMPERDRREEIQSLMRRMDALRRNPYIKHVISQPTPKLDFADVMQTKKIVLLRMPPWQDEESKAFIGTLVISQLLKTIMLRVEISEHLRTPFAIYCDEFQTFATPDFAKLFTQTGKYQIMPTVAHQERFSQFKPGDPNRGATLAAPNKVLFSLAVHDGEELAPEFAKEATTTEIRLEPELVISQEPFWDLLRRGHANRQIMELVRKHFQCLLDSYQKLREESESVLLTRTDYQNQAALHRDEASIVGIDEKRRRAKYESLSMDSE